MAETHLNQRFAVIGQSSVFNLKEAYNAFLNSLEHQGHMNIIRNPGLNGITVVSGSQIPEAWVTTGGLDLLAPVLDNPYAGTIKYLMPTSGEYLRQDISSKLELDTPYAIVLRLSNQGTMKVNVGTGAGNADIFNPDDSGQLDYSEALIPAVADGTFQNILLRFQTRTSQAAGGKRFNDAVWFTLESTDATTANVTFEDIIVVRGDFSLEGVEPQNVFLDNVRYASDATAGYFELSNDGGNTWGQLWTNGQQFNDHVAALIDSELTGVYLSKDDVSGTGGITITPVSDGTNWSIVVDGGGVSGGGGGGLGDWTKEDVLYQSILEHSDFSIVQYDAFLDETSVSTSIPGYQSATYVGGSSTWQGGINAAIETVDLVPADNTETLRSFFLYHVDATSTITAEYSIDGGSVWTPCTSNAITSVIAGFTTLKLRFIWGGTDELHSFGVFFAPYAYVGFGNKSFFEYLLAPADMTAGEVLVIPNGRWYTKDAASLEVFLNRVRLIEGIDYTETDIGYAEKSTSITLISPIATGDHIVFTEFYGQIDVGADNLTILTEEHTLTGRHKLRTIDIYVDSAIGSDANTGLDPLLPLATVDAAIALIYPGTNAIIHLEYNAGTYLMTRDATLVNSTVEFLGNGGANSCFLTVGIYEDAEHDAWYGFHVINSHVTFTHLYLSSEAAVWDNNLNNGGGFIKYNPKTSGTVIFDSPFIANNANDTVNLAPSCNLTVILKNAVFWTTSGSAITGIPFKLNATSFLTLLSSGSTEISGTYTKWRDAISGMSHKNGSPLNVRTNIDELHYIEDSNTGLFYQLDVTDGVLSLKYLP